jgi:hypothetical protein
LSPPRLASGGQALALLVAFPTAMANQNLQQ